MCKQCETNPVYEFTNKRKICSKCFINWFQKKVLYTIRKFGMVSKDSVIGYKPEKGFREVVLEDVLKMYSERAFIELIRLPSKKKIHKKAIASTTDLESFEIVNSVLKGKMSIKGCLPIRGKIIKPLYLFLDKEVLLYAKIKKLKFKKTRPNVAKLKEKRNMVKWFVDDLEIKHPEIKRAVLNSVLGLE